MLISYKIVYVFWWGFERLIYSGSKSGFHWEKLCQNLIIKVNNHYRKANKWNTSIHLTPVCYSFSSKCQGKIPHEKLCSFLVLPYPVNRNAFDRTHKRCHIFPTFHKIIIHYPSPSPCICLATDKTSCLSHPPPLSFIPFGLTWKLGDVSIFHWQHLRNKIKNISDRLILVLFLRSLWSNKEYSHREEKVPDIRY